MNFPDLILHCAESNGMFRSGAEQVLFKPQVSGNGVGSADDHQAFGYLGRAGNTMKIAQNLAIAVIICFGPFWPWNMVVGYIVLLVRVIRWILAARNRNPETGRLPAWRIATAAALVLIMFGISALALLAPPSSPG